MKKLVKAQFYKDIEKYGNAILIYKNPTGKEFDEIEEDSKWNSVRFFMQQDATTYAWDGAILHSNMEDWLPEIAGPVHFEFDKGSVWCYITPEIQNAEMLEEYLKKFPFAKYGYKNTNRFRIEYRYYDAPFDEAYDGVTTLQEFYNNMDYKREQANKQKENNENNNINDSNNNDLNNNDLFNFDDVESSLKSRLKKKAEFFDGIGKHGNMVEIYKNPTHKEVDIIKKNGNMKDVRGLLYKDGTLYLWNAEFYHEALIEQLKNLDFNQYHIFTNGPNWIRLHNDGVHIYEEEARTALNNCKSLSSIVNISNDVTLNIVGFDDKNGYVNSYYDTPLKDFIDGKNKKENGDMDSLKLDDKSDSDSDSDSGWNSYDYSTNSKSDVSDDYGPKISASKNIIRLKKSAEFFDGIMNGNDMVEIYKNPTAGEFNKLLRKSKWHSVRLFEKEDGTIYAWDSDILHEVMVNQKPSIKGPVHIEIFDDGQLDVFIEPSIKDAKTLRAYLDKLPLSNYGVSKSSIMNIDIMYYNAPNDPIYGGVSTLGDFYDLLDGKKKLYE